MRQGIQIKIQESPVEKCGRNPAHNYVKRNNNKPSHIHTEKSRIKNDCSSSVNSRRADFLSLLCLVNEVKLAIILLCERKSVCHSPAHHGIGDSEPPAGAQSTLADFNLARTGPSSLVMRAHSAERPTARWPACWKILICQDSAFILGMAKRERERKSDPGRRSPPTFAAWQHAFSPLCQRRKVEFPGRGTLFWKTLAPIISVHLVTLCDAKTHLLELSGCEIDWIGVLTEWTFKLRREKLSSP